MIELIAYLDDNRNWTKEQIAAQQLTCINYAFAKIRGVEIVGDLQKIHLINELKKEQPHLKSCISIGGWTADGFSEGVSTAENRHRLIQNLVTYMQHYQFDGIDLDWEYPGMDLAGIKAAPDDAENFLLFVQALRQKLDSLVHPLNRRYLLTAAIGASKKLMDTMSPNEKYEYLDFLDYVNVMTYDMRGSFTKTPGHHTNLAPYASPEGTLSVQTSVKQLLEKGIRPDKIVIGAAFYGRKWSGVRPDPGNPFGYSAHTFGNQTEDYQDLRTRFARHPEHCHWDEAAKAPYYYDGDLFISYDDSLSMKEKALYVQQAGLRGLMFWEYSLDLSGELLKPAADILLSFHSNSSIAREKIF